MIFLFPEVQMNPVYRLRLVGWLALCWILFILTFLLVDNYPEPGKRPLSSTAPTILEHSDGSFYLAVGGSGGVRIFGAMLQVLLNLDWGMNTSKAVEYGRLHDQLYPQILEAEAIYPREILDTLRDRGHNVTGDPRKLIIASQSGPNPPTVSDANLPGSVVQVVMQKGRKLFGQLTTVLEMSVQC